MLPQHPIGIVGDRKIERHAVQALQHPLRIALVIETRHMDRDHMQMLAIAFAQGRKVAQPLLAPGGTGVDESQRGDSPAQDGRVDGAGEGHAVPGVVARE